jgi:hypothetical protein
MSRLATPEPSSAYSKGTDGAQPIIVERLNGSKPVLHPGRGLGIASVIFTFVPGFGPIAGLAAGISSFRTSTQSGQSNPWAVVGITLSILSLIIHIAFAVWLVNRLH